jgi:CheY-like chemotaxis protein/anti-sigma regulatory factor (Ser/Thr protein kinase)
MLASVEVLGSIKFDKTNTEKFNESVNDQQKYIRSITLTSKHIISILNDVLGIDKIESAKLNINKSWFSVNALVKNVSEMFAAQLLSANSKMNIIHNANCNVKWLGAQKEIRQVFINLISNSIRHAPGSLVTVAINEDTDILRISIKDNGPGLSTTEIVNVFNTVDSKLASDGSSGLGLTICKSLIEDYIGGKISVSSKEGVGTEFSIELFLTKYSNENDADLSPVNFVTQENLLNSYEGKTLLLVDDSADVLAAISEGLMKLGFRTICASTSQEAMRIVQSGNKFDAALIDFNLGSSSTHDGIELSVGLINEGLSNVIGYTGNDSPEIAERWSKAGAKIILHKPLSISDVANNIMTLH